MLSRLKHMMGGSQLTALFQPIVQMEDGDIIGYEGLIRGAPGSELHSPLNLFKAAREHGLALEVERLCSRVVLQRFAWLALPGKLFLNVSPECLMAFDGQQARTLNFIESLGLHPRQLVIELTEGQPTHDYAALRETVSRYRTFGFQIAIDDLGEGFSSLRLWSELRPEYVKIDMHFVQGVQNDPVKRQFVRSIQQIADKSATMVIAEGIESRCELLLIRELGVVFGQGFHIARPSIDPSLQLDPEVAQSLVRDLRRQAAAPVPTDSNVSCVARNVAPAAPSASNNEVHARFIAEPALPSIPVVDAGVPLGLISRGDVIDWFANPSLRAQYGEKPCSLMMDSVPLIAEGDSPLLELSQNLVDGEQRHLTNGFIVTDHGQYLGMGSAHDLMREMTRMQIRAARYIHPLTQLPGNVPVDEHIAGLLRRGERFAACYLDIDNFKPFNETYGYDKGDELVQLTARLLVASVDMDRDFVGHTGGDDFIILFRSRDWELRCEAILASFGGTAPGFYDANAASIGGIVTTDRRGRVHFHPLACLSMGIARIEPAHYRSHHEIAAAAIEAKLQAKKIAGNSLFVNRRLGPAAGRVEGVAVGAEA